VHDPTSNAGDFSEPPCLACASNAGVRRISPAVPVLEGTYWLIEHAYPVGLLGWMVLVLRRHAAALHELAHDEMRELGDLQAALIPAALRELTACEKEYVACFAEAPGFRHVHVHVVPVPAELPDSVRGARVMTLLTVSAAAGVSVDAVRAFCAGTESKLIRRLFADVVEPHGRLLVGPVNAVQRAATIAARSAAGIAAPAVVQATDRNGKTRYVVWARPVTSDVAAV
jgi:diadenosine tetraphosphate (Ap4A) HIT family hydrolase